MTYTFTHKYPKTKDGVDLGKTRFNTTIDDEVLKKLAAKAKGGGKLKTINRVIETLVDNFIDCIDENGNVIKEKNITKNEKEKNGNNYSKRKLTKDQIETEVNLDHLINQFKE